MKNPHYDPDAVISAFGFGHQNDDITSRINTADEQESPSYNRLDITHSAGDKRNYSGYRSGVQGRIFRDKHGHLKIHITRWNQQKQTHSNQFEHILSLTFSKKIIEDSQNADRIVEEVDRIKIFDKDVARKSNGDWSINIDDIQKAVNQIMRTIREDREKPDIESIFTNHNIATNTNKNLIDLSAHFDENELNKPSSRRITFPTLFLHGLLSLEPHDNQNIYSDKIHDLVTDPDMGDVFEIFYTYGQDSENPNIIHNTAYLRQTTENKRRTKQGEDLKKTTKEVKIYDIAFGNPNKNGQVAWIKNLEFHGQQIDLSSVDKDKYALISRIMETIRKLNDAIYQKNFSKNSGKLFTHIFDQTGVLPHLPMPIDTIPSAQDGGLTEIHINGGVNDTGILSPTEETIGANSLSITQSHRGKDGKTYTSSIKNDLGIGFGDRKKDGYDSYTIGDDGSLGHIADKDHYTPHEYNIAMIFTHAHLDHFQPDLNFNYACLIVDPFMHPVVVQYIKEYKNISKERKTALINSIYVINPDIKRQDITFPTPANDSHDGSGDKNHLKDKIKAVFYHLDGQSDLPEQIKDFIQDKYHIINGNTFSADDVPDAYKTTTQIGPIKITYWVEAFMSDVRPGEIAYAPRLLLSEETGQYLPFEMRANYVSHSYPNLMFDIITKAGYMLSNTGDFKTSPDIYLGKGTDLGWVKAPTYTNDPNYTRILLCETTRLHHAGQSPGYSQLEDKFASFYVNAAKAGRRINLSAMTKDYQTLMMHLYALRRARKILLDEDLQTYQDHYAHIGFFGKGLIDTLEHLRKSADIDHIMAQSDDRYAGITLLGKQKKQKEIAKEQLHKNGMVRIITGTQGEKLAVTARLASNNYKDFNLMSHDIVINTKHTIPAPGNEIARQNIKDQIEYLGATCFYPEDFVAQGGWEFGAISGHGFYDDIAQMIAAAGPDYTIPTHGSNENKQALKKLTAQYKSTYYPVTAQDRFGGTLETQGLIYLGARLAPRQFTNDVYPGDLFFLSTGSDHSPLNEPTKLNPAISGNPIDVLMAATQAASLAQRDIDARKAKKLKLQDNIHAAHLTPPLPEIGIEKLRSKWVQDTDADNTNPLIWDALGIDKIISFDTEGSGLPHEGAALASLGAHGVDPYTRKEFMAELIEWGIPRHVIPSLFAMLKTHTPPGKWYEGQPARAGAYQVYQFFKNINANNSQALSPLINELNSRAKEYNLAHFFMLDNDAIDAWHETTDPDIAKQYDMLVRLVSDPAAALKSFDKIILAKKSGSDDIAANADPIISDIQSLLDNGVNPLILYRALSKAHKKPNNKGTAARNDLRLGDKIMQFIDDVQAKPGRSLLIGHNVSKYDKTMLRRFLQSNGYADSNLVQNANMLLFDTRHLARAVHGFAPGLINVNTNPKTGFLDFSLQGLCAANGIEYQDRHEALYDTYPAKELFFLIADKLAEHNYLDILEQMIINANVSSNDMVKDITGQNGIKRPGAPNPVFSYISAKADRPEPRIGVVVATEIDYSGGTYLVVQNLKYDPKDYMLLPQDQILSMVKDPKCDVFEIINTRQHPIIMPIDMAHRAEKKWLEHHAKKLSNPNTQTAIQYSRDIVMGEQNLTSSRQENKRQGANALSGYARSLRNAVTRFLKQRPFDRDMNGGRINSLFDKLSPKESVINQIKQGRGLNTTASAQIKRLDEIIPTLQEATDHFDPLVYAKLAIFISIEKNPELSFLLQSILYEMHEWTTPEDRTIIDDKLTQCLSDEFNLFMVQNAGQISGSGSESKRNKSKLIKDWRKKIWHNIDHCVASEDERRRQYAFAPASARHTTWSKFKQQIEAIERDPDLYQDFIGNHPGRKEIFTLAKLFLQAGLHDNHLLPPEAINDNPSPLKDLDYINATP